MPVRLSRLVFGVLGDIRVHLPGNPSLNQVWVNPAVKSANPSYQTIGCGGEKRNARFDRGGLIEKGMGFG